MTEHPMERALRLGATTIPDDITAEINEATNSGAPLPWPEYTDRDSEVWHLTDETHDGDRVMLPSACDMSLMLRRDVEHFFGPLHPATTIRDAARTAARQTTGQDDTRATCTSTHPVHPTRCILFGRHAVPHTDGNMQWPERIPAVGQPAEAHDTDRCPSCDHQRTYHDADGQCWFTVDWGRPESNLVCPCTPRPATVEDER